MVRTRLLMVATAALLLVGLAGPATADDAKQPFATQKSPPNSPSVEECTATGDPTADLRLDCDDPFPNNEPNVVVNPADPLHMVASSNDYGSCCDQYYTTFDGGRTWRTGNMSRRGPDVVGSDPITVFDPKHGTVIHFSLNFKVSAALPATNGDLVASVSRDGGLSWEVPVVVGQGIGAHLFNDKEDAVVDTDPTSPFYGRTYVTWTGFVGDVKRTLASPIVIAWSDDGGLTWSEPKVNSGSNRRYCTFQTSGPAGECDEDQGSAPRVGPGGVLHVAFQNAQNEAAWEPGEQFESQYLVVTSRDGGATFSKPVHVVDQEDGTRDFPLNASGRQTLTGLQVRVPTFGTMAADPRTGRLYITFIDNRAGTHDVAQPVTKAKVYIVTSTDGARWSAPVAVDTSDTESWFPWVDVAPDGTVGVIYNDRRPGNTYVAELAEGAPGAFSTQVVSAALSHPNQSLFFQAHVVGCEQCALFHGDYLGLDYGSDGVANLAWTDMRDQDPGTGLYRQFIYFARR